MFYKLSCSMVVSTTLAVLLTTTNLAAHASVTPDRTRLVFNESDKSISVTLRNNNEKLPYLAQSCLIWRKAGWKTRRATKSLRRWRYCHRCSVLTP